ncbi:glycine betaine ABC transporter substrate-binding protein [Solibacillus sp. MA9]|uniref:Glycine betaine ABC transporter substrate-binding protein n=1 Tax=Solibacillus palustris TaxID=2908203 RepID=A0ABS9UEJ2_9BACL|nr:glycine betaine ABC transporter substrate-binding protein [Solibacillus sp. MA9]MCH7322752.1 glycine betaine ABC transporter substrate-binding protein [Solibacillus sp. MA9]
MIKSKWMLGSVAMAATLLLSACGGEDSSESLGEINLAYVEWDTEVASTHVVAHVLEDMGYDVTLTPLDNAIMWEAVSKGEADAMVAGWLPATHAAQLEKYGADLEDLGANLEGAKIGLVVPSYMDVNSIEDLSDEAKKTITGIEPGAGIMSASENALKEYSNLEGWTLQSASSGAMTVALDQAIKNNEEIIVTGWSPHWKFASYDLKYLEDPKGIYGGAENIHTFAHKGLAEDHAEAYKVLDAFSWTVEDMEEVMLDIQDGTSPKEAAEKWVKDNSELVESWKK